MKPFLPKSDLVDGVYYKGRCRNATVAVWDQENNLFWYIRTKFGSHFAESICHPDDENRYDVFHAHEVVDPNDFERVDIEAVKKWHKELEAYREEWTKKNRPNG